jgi:CheY-like chemotaxis protein
MSAKILLVDDQAVMLRLVGVPLEREGYTILTAMSAAEGLTKLHGERPDLIILDVLLPDYSGLELCRRIRADPKYADLPIIILSGRTETEAKVAGLEAGADEYVTKPVDPAEMVARVRHLLMRTERLRQASPAARAQARIIACVGATGGIGATTLSANLATALAQTGKQTLIIEMRPYYGPMAAYFALQPTSGLSEVAEATAPKIDTGRVSARLQDGPFNLRLLTGPQRLREYRDIQPDQVEAILTASTQLAEYIVVDLPSLPSVANRAVLRRAHAVLAVLEPTPACLAAGQALLELLRAWGISPAITHPVLIDRSGVPNALSADAVARGLGCSVRGYIPAAPEHMLAAQTAGAPVVISAPNSAAAVAYTGLADALLARRPAPPTVGDTAPAPASVPNSIPSSSAAAVPNAGVLVNGATHNNVLQ